MRVLVGMECSGIVRNAFVAAGHDAMSCDYKSEEQPRPDGWDGHYKGDIFELLADKSYSFDMLIAHPPCTDLSVSGARYFKDKKEQQEQALDVVRRLMAADIDRICIENPVSIISSRIRKPDQIIQPYKFGHDASKTTCLWLKNLPPLVSTKRATPRAVEKLGGIGRRWRFSNQTDSGQNRLAPSEHRAADRARTYQGIADAMAQQWGSLSL